MSHHHICPTARGIAGTLSAIIAGALAAVLASGCASQSLLSDPTPEKPRVGCIAGKDQLASRRMNPRTGGVVLPEIVHAIGVTPLEDRSRWMIIRGTYLKSMCAGERVNDMESCPWVPYERDEIQFGPAYCGAQLKGYVDLMKREVE